MTYCPWSGAKDCGCATFPFLWNEQMPERCQELMPMAMRNAHFSRLSPERVAEYKAWIASCNAVPAAKREK